MPARLRILCLHGFAQSAAQFRARTGALRRALKQRAELLYAEGPHHLPMEEGLGRFCWWRHNDGCYEGAEESLAYLERLVEENEVDGVLGFSQGAVVAALLAAMPDRFPRLRLLICIGGFLPRDAALLSHFADPIPVPSLHVAGRADQIVPLDQSTALAARFSDAEVLLHDSGHYIPADGESKRVYRALMDRVTA